MKTTYTLKNGCPVNPYDAETKAAKKSRDYHDLYGTEAQWAGDGIEYRVECVNTDGEYINDQFITLPKGLPDYAVRSLIMNNLIAGNRDACPVAWEPADV